MSNGQFASRKAVEIEAKQKSSGETALNENQIPTPYNWQHSADKKTVLLTMKNGYVAAGGPFQLGENVISVDTVIEAGSFNYLSIGPITIAEGVTVTIEDGGNWVIV